MAGTTAISRSGRNRMAVLGAVTVALGVTAVLGSATRAQNEVSVEIVSVDASGTKPITERSMAPASSDDALTIAFETGSGAAEPRVWIRDRAAQASRPVADASSRAPGISGDGCVVAYSVVDVESITLYAAELCDPETGEATTGQAIPVADRVDEIPREADPPIVAAPALSTDGTVIVWSTGQEVRRYVRPKPTDLYERTDVFDATITPTADSVTGVDVDVSADGATVVFVAGPGAVPYAPAPANVYVWNHDDATAEPTIEVASFTGDGLPGSSDSGSASVSADGSLVVFDSTSADVAVAAADLAVDDAAAADADTAVDDAAELDTAAAPFVAVYDRVSRTSGRLIADASRPSISADGNHVVYERDGAVRVMSSANGQFVVDRAPAVLRAVRPTSRVSISATGEWLVLDATTAPIGAPAALASGTQVWAAEFDSPTTTSTTTTTTTTTTPASTVPPTTVDTGTTLPATTVPDTWFDPTGIPVTTVPRPRFTIPAPTRRPTTSRNSNTSRRTTGFEATPSATSIVFAPTVVEAGRRDASVELSNPSSRSITVSATAIAPPGPFSIVDDGCSGILGAGSRCVVQVQFAPITVGAATASLVFQLDDLPAVVATLEGEGSPEPTVDLVPTVAGAGQTVTVFGAGFPAGSSVQFVREELPGSEAVTVDADGTFAHVVVVLPNTPAGPTTWSVESQPDLFAQSSAQLLVSNRGANAAGAALRGTVTGR